MTTPPAPVTCSTDAECPDKMGCCMMVDPGSVPADNLKFNGLLTTKGKQCATVVAKTIVDGLRMAKLPE